MRKPEASQSAQDYNSRKALQALNCVNFSLLCPLQELPVSVGGAKRVFQWAPPWAEGAGKLSLEPSWGGVG